MSDRPGSKGKESTEPKSKEGTGDGSCGDSSPPQGQEQKTKTVRRPGGNLPKR